MFDAEIVDIDLLDLMPLDAYRPEEEWGGGAEVPAAEDTAGVPAGLESLEPGPVLAAFLSTVDVEAVSGADRVRVLRARQRLLSHVQAQLYSDMTAVAQAVTDSFDDDFGDSELIIDASTAEIRVALGLTRRAADAELSLAMALRDRFPQVAGALRSGAIDLRRARVMISGVSHLPVETAQAVVDQLLDDAQTSTTGQLAARIRRLCIEADPEEAHDRYQQALDDRRLITEPSVDGTAHLMGMDLPPDRVAHATAAIDRLARRLKTSDETRSLDQLRADVLLDLLDPGGRTEMADGDGAGRSRGGVVITIDLETLSGLADHPGELGGFGPVIADIARQTAGRLIQSEWRFVVFDAEGRPLRAGTTRRRPGDRDRRLIETAYPTCVFPGCRIPAHRCDLDHRTPFAGGGPTDIDNMAPVCRHDHRVRHAAGWEYTRRPDGHHEWTTRLGCCYTTASGTPP